MVLSTGPLAEAAETIHNLYASILDGAPTRVSVMEKDRLAPMVTTGTSWSNVGEPDRLSDRNVGCLPLISRGRLVGLVDVIAPAEVVEDAHDALEAAGRQGAALLESVAASYDLTRRFDALLEDSARLQTKLGGLDEMLHVFESLIGSATPEEAIRSLTKFCSDHYGVPIAVWLKQGDGRHFKLVSCRGLSTKRSHELRNSMRMIRLDGGSSGNDHDHLSRFLAITESTNARVLALDEVLVIWREAGGDADQLTEALVRYVESLLTYLATIKRGQLCSERLDEGIALTAHEMKSPVVAAMAAIDFVRGSGDIDDRRRHLLAASRQELRKLSELIDSLLLSAKSRAQEVEKTNLADLVQEAAESCSWESGEGRVTVDTPADVPVQGEVTQLRAAVKNMISTALTYTPAGFRVTVRVKDDEGRATVSVRDHGPPAPEEELSAIFEPVLRSEKTGSRAGKTLGLVVTKRVALALGGRVWAEPCPDGAVVHFQLPLSA